MAIFSGSQTPGGAALILADGASPTGYTIYAIDKGSTVTVTPLKGHLDAELYPTDGTQAASLQAASQIFSNFGDS